MDTHNAINALSGSVDITLYAACGIVIRITYRDTLVTICDTYRDTNRSRYNTRIAGPSIAMHRCIVTTLVDMAHTLKFDHPSKS